ncbi:MAG: sugar ABC transporter permease [Lachnospiraceae bacterium]|nr:sugar ABC transporter permease [Lachnospiraceae bacterium]
MKAILSEDGSSEKLVKRTACLFMGAAHIRYFKDRLTGCFFALIELVTLLLIPFWVQKIKGLITLGDPHPELAVKFRDNSVFMMIDGVIALAILCIVVLLYVMSVKDAMERYKKFCIRGSISEKQRGLSDKVFPVAGLLPAVILILFFVVVPLVFSALVAFTDYSNPEHIPPNNLVNWVGMQNFADLFGGKADWAVAFGRTAVWTLVWAFFATFTCFFGGFILAAMLQSRRVRIAPVFRSIFILPYAVPSIVSMLVWKNLLNGSFGIVNRTLMQWGWISGPIPWLSDTGICRVVCIVINLWAGFSYFMLLTMGSMTAIPSDIVEAARIDGASPFQIFRKITLPLVLFQTMPLLIMGFMHNINNFGAIYFLTGGLPEAADSTVTSSGSTDILITWIYKLTMAMMKYNYASVLAIVIFLVMAPFAILVFRNTKSYKEGEL